jgi:hypothetical protein
MDGRQLFARKFLTALLLCTLTLVSAMSSACRVCDRMDEDPSRPQDLHGPGHDGTDSCDKDGCSCCGFQLVVTDVPSILTQNQSIEIVRMPVALPPAEPIVDLNYPPRR